MEMSDASLPTPAGTVSASVANHETVIEARPGWVLVDWAALVEYRDLLLLLVLRDLEARYKPPVLGPIWSIIGPVMSMILFSLIFGGIAQMPSEDRPYYLWSFAALVPWALFTGSLNGTATSLVGNSHLIKKVYFPRL